MIQEQVIPINFGGGVDSKTDPKAVVPGKFIRLENAVFTKPNQIAKRNGSVALNSTIASVGSMSNPKLVHGYKNEIISADQNKLISYSTNQTAWESKGDYISTELTKLSIDQSTPSSGYVDSAVLGNYVLYGWSTALYDLSPYPTIYSKSYGSVVDLSTNTVLVGPSLLSTKTVPVIYNPIKCVVLGTSSLAIVYLNAGSTAIVMRIVSFSGSGVVTFGSELTISTNLSASNFLFDIVTTSTGASIAYFSTTGVTVSNINTSGSVTSTLNTVDANAIGPLTINLNGSNLWVYYCNGSGGPPITTNSIVYLILSTSLVSVLAKTTVIALSSPYYVSNFIQVINSATQQTLYYGQYVTTDSPLASTSFTDVTYSITQTTSGTIGTNTFFANGVTPYSKSFTDNSSNYAVFVYRSALFSPSGVINIIRDQPTYFILKLSSETIPICVGRFAYGLANNQNILETIIGYQPTVNTVSSRKYIFGVGVEIQTAVGNYYTASSSTPGGLTGSFSYLVDFNSENAYRSVNAGDLAILNGGMISQYDGQNCVEFGFHLAPEITVLLPSNGAGGLTNNGQYAYLAIYQWTDAQGNVHQSAPSIIKNVTMGGTDDTVNLAVSSPYLSKKQNVSIAIYRTVSQGNVFYLITNPLFPINASPTVGTAYTWTDLLSDAQIIGNAQAYAYEGNPTLENSTPPPSMVMLTHNNRLWFVDSENPNNIWYTKSFQPGVGLSPSAFMTQQIDGKFGEITALAEMDEKLCIFKENGIFIQAGDGVNDTGTGSTLSFPQFVPSDIGCSTLKSTITMPNGVMFKSINGIYLLDRSLNVTYIGAEVESYNSQTITGVSLVPSKSQIRFICSSGLSLVYDYIFKQWSTFTNYTGTSCSTWNNSFVYSNGSVILQETQGTYTENGTAFSLLAQTSWLALASIQGFQRVKRLIMLGDFTNGNSASHNLSISAAYDFSTTFQQAITYAFGAVSASGVFQYRERLPIQKCDSLSLLIQETTTGSSAEYIDLTNISFEAGVKKGVNKLGGIQSVG